MDPVSIKRPEASSSFKMSTDKSQVVPRRHPGASTHQSLLKWKGCSGGLCIENERYQIFSPQPLTLMPYLDGIYTFGNNIIEPGAMIHTDPISLSTQYAKVKLSRLGITYSGQTPIGYTAFTGPKAQTSRNSYTSYHSTLVGNWTFLRDKHTGEGVFGTMAVKQGDGFDFNINDETPQKNIGGITDPSGYYQRQGGYINQVALGYVGCRGKLVVLAGMLDLGNTMDKNAYANAGSNELMNKALVNTPSLPVTVPGLGFQVACQPDDSIYMMWSSVSNNTPPNKNPFRYLNINHWSNIFEVGLIRENALGLGKGIYRFQPFYTTTDGHAGFGIAANFQQQLGKNAPYGWFFRGGIADSEASRILGVKCSAATGFVVLSPFSLWRKKTKATNREYIGLGITWAQAASHVRKTNMHEYGIELTYVMQVTPTMTIQPDIQIIRDPIYGKKSGQTNVVFQIQNTWQY